MNLKNHITKTTFLPAVLQLLEKKKIEYHIDEVSVYGNIIGKIENDHLIINEENQIIPVGTYDAINVLLFAVDYDLHAFTNKLYEITQHPFPYIRVATDYFKKINKVDRYGIKREELIKWKIETLRLDHGKEILSRLPMYDTFTIHPDNIEYNRIVDNCYNLYAPFSHEPSFSPGEWSWTEHLLRHVFGEQYELGLQYFQLLYLYPKQILPILVLVSKERETGKSTFINYLDILFGANMVVINPQDIARDFNDSYGLKNVIAIEESRFDSVQVLEKLKNIATQSKILINPKGIQPYSVSFYGKLIITSNDENKFSKVDREEIRYWIRKIPKMDKSKKNTAILNDLRDEIPYFLNYLQSLPAPDFSKSRMVFTAEEINTEALEITKESSVTDLYLTLNEHFKDMFNNDSKLQEIEFTIKDVKNKWFTNNNQITFKYIKSVLTSEFNLSTNSIRRYYPFGEVQINSQVGSPYKLMRKDMNLEELDTETNNDLPF